MKHGLLRKKVHLMNGESRYLYTKLNRNLSAFWEPRNPAEKLLVEQLVFNYWRLKRAYKLETELIQAAEEEAESTRKSFEKMGSQRNIYSVERLNFENLDRFRRYINSIQRQILRILHELERIQAARNGRTVPLPLAVDMDIEQSVD